MMMVRKFFIRSLPSTRMADNTRDLLTLTAWAIGFYLISLFSLWFIFRDIYLWGGAVLAFDALLVILALYWSLEAYRVNYHPLTGIILFILFGVIYSNLWLNDFDIMYTQAHFLSLALSGLYFSFFIGTTR
jgi:hypothetical protein